MAFLVPRSHRICCTKKNSVAECDKGNGDQQKKKRKREKSKAAPRALAITDTLYLTISPWAVAKIHEYETRQKHKALKCYADLCGRSNGKNDIRDQFFVCFYLFYIVMSFRVPTRAQKKYFTSSLQDHINMSLV